MEDTLVGPPRSFPIKSLTELRDRSYFDSPNFEFNKSSVPLSVQTSDKEIGSSREKRPRLLACHDLKGNYLDDQWIQGSQNPHAYTLGHWRLLDIFVYFSHELVTLPPPSWTNAAHKHGVQVLGTFITEWVVGAEVCRELLASEACCRMYAERLAELAEALGFDGWLINIENKVEKEHVATLQEFVRHLTVRMHLLVPDSLVIWYDSVTTDGKLDWQNRLNEKNKQFFDVCDGIFTNYTWKEGYPRQSAAAAGVGRAVDVYMGVDVFGRGSFGGGQYACDVALNAARAAGVSVALFAPAWPYETNNDQRRWWETIERCWPAARPDPVILPFFTDFDIGLGIAMCIAAKRVSDLPWSNLSSQNLQPRLLVAAADKGQLTVSVPQESAVYSGGVSIKAVGDLAHDEVCIVQLYHTETIVEAASLNISYSVMAQTNSNFALALSVEDRKGSKVIFFLLESEDTDAHSFPSSHNFTHVSVVFEHAVKGLDSSLSGVSRVSGGDATEKNESFALNSLVSDGKQWTVREFVLEWGNYTLVDIFGVYSASKDLQPILIKLLLENENIIDGESFVKQAKSKEEGKRFGNGMSPVNPNVDYCSRLGHISMTTDGHEHATSTDLEFLGCPPSWFRDGVNTYLSLKLRWELPKNKTGSWSSRTYHLFVSVKSSDENPTPTYLGMTMLGCFYIYMLPLPKSPSSVIFNLLSQCPCGKVIPVSDGTYTLPVPSPESGHYVRTQRTPHDLLFKELQ